MDLRKFPMDAQICDIRIMSYAFNTKDIVLTWQGVTISDEVELPEYDVSEDIDMGDCTQTYISGTYSCLVGNFTLTRRLSYYVVQTYIPSILIVVLSWVNFWLDASATPARVCLGLLCVLTMTTQNSGILSTLPRVSYVKSIDVWSSACLVFVFGALLEFAVVNVQCRKMELLEKKKSKLNLVTNGAQSDDPEKDQKFCFKPVVVTAERVDFLSRIIFPSSFAIFNLVYWQKYLIENVG
ncbi:glycine receptor subunit alpha-2-like [Liolophura sinensis]|uniref:glycine receptor subunit alpha-2-like n=1 Tax=Liolophura sinensis TaxID=3198878 RepID=UPI00315903E3